ncbi:MAG: NAD(+)/NADH kinase [Myxococcota bacterium]|nr:NAD(+)/NADH kinase [Myxococcota bacterium]
MIRQDPDSEKARAMHDALSQSGALKNVPEDVCLVIGGDGFMLESINEMGPDWTYLGINAGTLGFLLNDLGDLELTSKRIQEREWTVREFPRLRLEGKTASDAELSGMAVNDVYLERTSGNTAHLRVRVNGVEVVNQMACDGLIVATALGSTAYSFSAGGSACHPDLRLIQLTAICPHLPKLPPITLPQSAIIEVESLHMDKRPARVVTDGREQDSVAWVRIENAESDIKLAYLGGHHPTATLIRKLLS